MNYTPDQLKGFYMISLLRKFLYCIYHTSRYPDRDSMVCHRILTYGKYFETLAHDELENYIGNIRNDIMNNHKNRGTYAVNIHVLTTPGLNHAFSSLLSGKFKSQTVVIEHILTIHGCRIFLFLGVLDFIRIK